MIDDEKCYDIKRILYIGFGNPLQKRSQKERRKEPADDDVWFDVLGTFGDLDDEDDPGGPDRRWVQMEDLGHCSKQHVKAAIAAYEQKDKRAAQQALNGHVSAE